MSDGPARLPPAEERLAVFIARELQFGECESEVSRLSGDASTRQYFRYRGSSRHSFILTVYAEPFDPDDFPYRKMHDLFRQIGLPVPELYQMEGSLGIVLQQDLGDLSLLQHLQSASQSERRQWLGQAIDYILSLQQQGTAALRPDHQAARLCFDQATLEWELDFFRKHYLEAWRHTVPNDRPALADEFSRLARELAAFPRCLCHRDFQVRNLMLKEGTIYVIDFQDARLGPASYDLVSLLKDSISLEAAEVDRARKTYLDQASPLLDGKLLEDFERQFELMTIQRMLKALGTYGYQMAVRGRHQYQAYVRGSLERARMALQAVPEFPALRLLVEEELD